MSTSVQLKSDETAQLLNKPYVNEVTLTGQNPLLKYCWPLELLTKFKKVMDLSMLKIWSLSVKGMQSYWTSNSENDLTLGDLESGPKAVAHFLAVKAEECTSAKFDGQ